MKKSLLTLPLVLMAAALILSACGGGGSSSSGGGEEEGAVTEALEQAATSTKPSKCTEFQTEEFNKQNEPEASNPVKTCEKEVEEGGNKVESIDVSNVKVDGETATAEAAITGSALEGQTVELEAVKEEGQWKLNQFLGFAKFDGQALGEAFEEEFAKQEGVSSSLAKCISEGVAEASQEEAEAMAFEGDLGPIEKLAEKCQ